MKPSFSCICVTGGRHSYVEEAVAMFVRQDYDDESELVILNTCPEQRLELGNGYSNVRIVNLTERPKSLGEARNMAITCATCDWIITWDDDDVYLPNHLRNFAEHADGRSWLWQSQQFYLEGHRIKGVVAGTMNVVAFTKAAWGTLGGYNALSVGEDRAFVGKLTSNFPGVKINLPPGRISFGYGWGQPLYHISGLGDDRTGAKPAWKRADEFIQKQIKAGHIPTGTITLKPQLRHDYEEMVRRYHGGKPMIASTVARGSVAMVLLGRYGDIINVLPILKHIAESYEKPSLVVSREFASMLDGVSYVTPYIVDVPYDDLKAAIHIAQRRFKHVIMAQVHGKGMPFARETSAYNLDSWRLAGFLHRWNDKALTTVFDQRNEAREQALCTKLTVPDKPMLLYKLDEAISSRCPDGTKLIPPLKDAFGATHNLVNLSDVKAERIFDLLGLYDRAVALVTLDTATLHLAAASPVPFVALVNPEPWLGSVPRGNCIARITYKEALANPNLIVEAINKNQTPCKD